MNKITQLSMLKNIDCEVKIARIPFPNVSSGTAVAIDSDTRMLSNH